MADYYASARSNYFSVRDRSEFERALGPVFEAGEISISEGEDCHDGKICLLVESFHGCWPTACLSVEGLLDLAKLVAPHLEDEEVAIFFEAGSEKLRYIAGIALAINCKGEYREVNLDSIYELAKDLGGKITVARY
jgi:hypothetical protein